MENSRGDVKMKKPNYYQIPVTLGIKLVGCHMEGDGTVLPTRVLSLAGSIKLTQWLEHHARLPQFITVWIKQLDLNPAGLSQSVTLPKHDTNSGSEETLTLEPEDFTWYVTD
jgi:hypothetical protein